jgi:hypothetical protein
MSHQMRAAATAQTRPCATIEAQPVQIIVQKGATFWGLLVAGRVRCSMTKFLHDHAGNRQTLAL